MISQHVCDATRKPFGIITSISTMQRRLKGFSSKIPVNCPNGIFSQLSYIQVHQSSKMQPDTFIKFSDFLQDKATMNCMLPRRENRPFLTCLLCDVAICLQKERNCFYNITHNLAVTQILKTSLELYFHDMKILMT